MDEQRMKENSVSFLHCDIHPGVIFVIVLDPMKHEVNSSVPLGIIVRFQGAFVSSWEHNQTAIFPVDVLHGRPGTNNVIAGPEGEIVQILVQGVTGCLLASIWRFVYQHCMHGHNIGSSEALHILQNLRKGAVSEEFFIFLEILDLGDHFLTWNIFRFANGHISHQHQSQWFHLPSADSFKLNPKAFNISIRYQIFNDKKPIFFIKLSLF